MRRLPGSRCIARPAVKNVSGDWQRYNFGMEARTAPPTGSDGNAGTNVPFPTRAAVVQVRARLLRLCERWTGDEATAEDIVQEAMLVVWRQACQGRTPNDEQSYLVGVARRLCLSWRSRQSRREVRGWNWESGEGNFGGLIEQGNDSDPLALLLHTERAELLDRALAKLPPNARTLLIAYYINEHSLNQIADRFGLTENAAAARMHRSRDALYRIFSGALRDDAVAYGLLPPSVLSNWVETRLWCPRCGRVRLQGRFDATAGNYQYALRCHDCDPGGTPPLGFTSVATPLEPYSVLSGVRGYRAAFKRVHRGV